MPNRRLTDDDIAGLYRRSSLNPGRFALRLGHIAVLTVNWPRRWLTSERH